MYGILMLVDIAVCFFAQHYDYMLSSIILLVGILISKLLFENDKYDLGIFFLSVVFYGIGFYHTIVLENYNTCYFILLIAPVIASLLLEKIYIKYLLIAASSVLFLLCNYLSGFKLFENYFFYFGLYPSSFLMIHFYNKLKSLTIEKNNLIGELKGKNEEILLFSNMMSHDLKAPLRNIEGFSNLLQNKLTGLDKTDSELLSFIVSGVNSMKKLIDDLLQFSKFSISDYSFKEIDLENLIDKLLFSFNYDIEKCNVEIIKSDLSEVYGHEESLSLVLQNLISNSIKFQPKDELHKPKIEIRQKKDLEKDIIIVKDNGIGIDHQKVKEIFLPFKRLHSSSDYEGTGLGMSIVNKVIEKHNAKIEVESERGKGSTFIISLPVN